MKTKEKPNPSIFLSLLWNPDRPDPEFARMLSASQSISALLPGLVKHVSEMNGSLKRMNGLFSTLRDNGGGYSDNADDRRKLAELLEQFAEEAKRLKAFLGPGVEKPEPNIRW